MGPCGCGVIHEKKIPGCAVRRYFLSSSIYQERRRGAALARDAAVRTTHQVSEGAKKLLRQVDWESRLVKYDGLGDNWD